MITSLLPLKKNWKACTKKELDRPDQMNSCSTESQKRLMAAQAATSCYTPVICRSLPSQRSIKVCLTYACLPSPKTYSQGSEKYYDSLMLK